MLVQRRPQKGFPRFRYKNEEDELRDARISVRRWWFEFLRLSKTYWLLSRTYGRTFDPTLLRVWDAFGDIYSVSFDEWWRRRGCHVFEEQIDPPRVKMIKPDLSDLREPSKDRALLEVPLILRKETVMKQIRKMLATVDFARPRNVLETSNSSFPINPVAYRLHVLEKTHQVWSAHRELILKPKRAAGLNPSAEQERCDLFQLGKMLNLSPANALLSDDYDELKRRQNRMRATVSRYLRRANQLISCVTYGRFPAFYMYQPNTEGYYSPRHLARHKALEEAWWSLDLSLRPADQPIYGEDWDEGNN